MTSGMKSKLFQMSLSHNVGQIGMKRGRAGELVVGIQGTMKKPEMGQCDS